MLRIDRQSRTFSRLVEPTLSEAQFLERADLQECIFNSSAAFFAEVGEEVFVVGQEIKPSNTVQDRIDLMAVDREGATVIVELKRGSNKLQMFQAISYAAMVSRWDADDFRTLLSDDDWEALQDFLEVDIDDLNRRQRILLVAEGFDYALLSGAEWLSEQHGVDIRCSTVSLASDAATGAEYLACASVFPPQALAEQAVSRGRGATRRATSVKWSDWDEALEAIENEALRTYARAQFTAGRNSYLRKRSFRYYVGARRRWELACRTRHGYVWQRGRFEGDVEYWIERLGDDANVRPVKQGRALSFNVHTKADITVFDEAVRGELTRVAWQASAETADDETM